MSEELHDKIAAIHKEHNAHPSASQGDWDMNMMTCRCGKEVGDDDGMANHFTDVVVSATMQREWAISEPSHLDGKEILSMYVDDRAELDAIHLHPSESIVYRYVTDWFGPADE